MEGDVGGRGDREERTEGSVRELSHTADIGFRVEASTLADLFRLAASGLVAALGTEPAGESRREERIRLARPDLERLFVAWLRELLHGAMAGRSVPSVKEIAVEEDANGDVARISARVAWRAWGPETDPEREIKGVTYHGLEVRREDDRWHATVVLDV